MSKTNLLVVGIVLLVIGFAIGFSSFGTDDTTENVSKSAKSYEMVAQADGLAIWQFGTPQNPLNVELLPLGMRDVNEAGTAYTTVNKPLMFSNKIKETSGSIKITVSDRTAKDGPDSKDKATMEANFKGPNGEDFRVVLKKLISKGGAHEMFGGVGTDVLMHGGTAIGTPLVAEEFSYITLWGVGDFYKDGELVDQGRIIHVMVSERTRDEDFKVGFGVAKPDELEIHLAMPPKKGTPTGPIDSSLPTGVILPNGVEQPFIHTNFYGDIKITGNQFVK